MLLKEFMQQGFSLATLDSLEEWGKRREYCERYLGEPIGRGSSRITYEIGDDEVIKLAIQNTSYGCFQNGQEYTNYIRAKRRNSQLAELFPKVYQRAEDDSWITCERVLPFTDRDAKEVLGIPYDDSDDNPSLVDFIEWAEYTIKDPSLNTEKQNHFYKNLMGKTPWFKLLYKYILSEGNGSTDLYDDNFGLTLRNGKPFIVVLDSGFDELDIRESKQIDNIIKESINSYIKRNTKK